MDDLNLINDEEVSVVLQEEISNIGDGDIRYDMNDPYLGSLCASLRAIYHTTNDEQIKNLCVEATIQGKKIAKKLEEYKILKK